MCRSWRELSNEYLVAKTGFDTAENEPCKVCPNIISYYRSPRFDAAAFKAVEESTGADLENIVYYRGEDIHYFVMTVTAECLEGLGCVPVVEDARRH